MKQVRVIRNRDGHGCSLCTRVHKKKEKRNRDGNVVTSYRCGTKMGGVL